MSERGDEPSAEDAASASVHRLISFSFFGGIYCGFSTRTRWIGKKVLCNYPQFLFENILYPGAYRYIQEFQRRSCEFVIIASWSTNNHGDKMQCLMKENEKK
jgi:hypothetical protein